MQNSPSLNAKKRANVPQLWMMIVAQLDPARVEYSTKDIAPLLNITPHALRTYCRQLWPRHQVAQEALYYLTFDEAAILIHRVCRDGRKLPELFALHAKLLREGIVTEHFPEDAPRVVRAGQSIIAARETRNRQRLLDAGSFLRPVAKSTSVSA